MSAQIDPASFNPTTSRPVGDLLYETAGLAPGTAAHMLPGLLESIRSHLGMDVGFISRFRDGRREFMHVRSAEGREVISENSSDALEDSVCLKVVEGKVPNLVNDAQAEPGMREVEAVQRLGIRAHGCVAIHLDDGEVVGTLCCFSTRTEKTLDDKNIAFMSVIADLIGKAVQNEQVHERQVAKAQEHLHDILSSGTLQMVWQPVTDSATRQITAVEALARFRTELYRPPNEWFDEAGAIGMGTELERNAFLKGVDILADLPDGVSLGFNIGGATILDREFQEFLMEQDLRRLVIEITEHDIINDYQPLFEALKPFRRRGLRLAIDDFGAGYAGFRHILSLQPDIIKLDMSILRGIDTNPRAQSVARALVAFAADTASDLIAEGVETDAELTTLNDLGITRVQGYVKHKPLERDQLLVAIHDNRIWDTGTDKGRIPALSK